MRISVPQNQTLIAHLKSQSNQTLLQLFGTTIWQRSKDYVDGIEIISCSDDKILAEVEGTDLYTLSLVRKNQTWEGDCDCPYDSGDCKHLAALLQAICKLSEEDIADFENQALHFRDYVNQLTIEELRKIVLEFAPEDFRRVTAIRQENIATPLSVSAICARVIHLFKKTKNDIVTGEVAAILAPLEAAGDAAASKVTDMLVTCIAYHETAQALHDYDYYGEEDESSIGKVATDEIYDFCCNFLANLSVPAKLSLLAAVQGATDDCNFDTRFVNILSDIDRYVAPHEVPAMKPMMIEALSLRAAQWEIYTFLEPFLSLEEREAHLRQLVTSPNEYRFVPLLVELLEEKKTPLSALKVLKDYLHGKVEKPYSIYFIDIDADTLVLYRHLLRLDRAHNGGVEVDAHLRKLVGYAPMAKVLRFALAEAPNLQQALEAIVAERNPWQYIEYLEQSNRTDEAVKCFRTQPETFAINARYPFFTRHKMRYPEDALLMFRYLMEQKLQETNKDAYDKVIEILSHIQALVAPEEFMRQVNGLQAQYFRRRKFLEKLIAAFGSMK